MSEEKKPRYKEEIDIGPDLESFGAAHDSGRSKTNREARSYKPSRKGRPFGWLKSL